ncbi:MAG: hypothetical protein H7Z42_16770 [Roseiflexaceae bacterium]|nr:hypothetical protein [Roseiflexaceae bacterium]
MSFSFETYNSLLLPLVILGGYFGWQRGFWGEAGFTIGMALTLLATVIYPVEFISIISRVIVLFPRILNVALGLSLDLPTSDDLFGAPDTGRFLLTRVLIFALLAFLVYSGRYAWAYDKGKARAPKANLGRFVGAVFGAASGFFWFLAGTNFLDALRALRADPRIPPEGTVISVPIINNPETLLGLVPTMLVVTLLVLMVLALLRLPNIWRDS